MKELCLFWRLARFGFAMRRSKTLGFRIGQTFASLSARTLMAECTTAMGSRLGCCWFALVLALGFAATRFTQAEHLTTITIHQTNVARRPTCDFVNAHQKHAANRQAFAANAADQRGIDVQPLRDLQIGFQFQLGAKSLEHHFGVIAGEIDARFGAAGSVGHGGHHSQKRYVSVS